MEALFLAMDSNFGLDKIIGNKKFESEEQDVCIEESRKIANLLSSIRDNTRVDFLIKKDSNILYNSHAG